MAEKELSLNRAEMKRLREKLGLTLDDAAKRAGFNNRQQWYKIESGVVADVTLKTLGRIARALECPPVKLQKMV